MEAVQDKKQTSFWPYAIIMLFVCFALFIGQFVYRSMQNPTTLVDENYYSQELAYQDVIDAKSRGLVVKKEMNIQLDNKIVVIDFVEGWKDIIGEVYLYNPMGSDKDIKQTFSIKGSKLQMKLRGLSAGFYVLKLHFSHQQVDYYLEQKLNVN